MSTCDVSQLTVYTWTCARPHSRYLKTKLFNLHAVRVTLSAEKLEWLEYIKDLFLSETKSIVFATSKTFTSSFSSQTSALLLSSTTKFKWKSSSLNTRMHPYTVQL